MIEYEWCKKENNINMNKKFLKVEDAKFTRERYNKMYRLEVEVQ